MAGLTEIFKKSWTIVDDPKADQKERMKAISIILQCYDKRLELLNIEPQVNGMRDYIEAVKKSEKEVNKRERALKAYLVGRKLTCEEIERETDPQRIF